MRAFLRDEGQLVRQVGNRKNGEKVVERKAATVAI